MSLSMVHSQKSTIGRANVVQKLMSGLSTVAPGFAAIAAEQLFVTVVQHKRPRREDAWADGASRISIPSPHGELAAWVWGDGPSTILLVHGWAGRGLQLGAFVEPLVDAGYRVVAYDGPAHGESSGRRTNIFKLTEALMAVADAIGPVTGVIAHSLGTTAVLLASSRYGFRPGRFVAVSPMAYTGTMTEHYSRMTGFSQAVVGEMRARLEKSIGFCWDEIEPLNLASKFEIDTLVIHDHDDLELPAAEGKALASRMAMADTLFTEGLGHRRILRDPAVVAAAIGFSVRCQSVDSETSPLNGSRRCRWTAASCGRPDSSRTWA